MSDDTPVEYPSRRRADPWSRDAGAAFYSLEREQYAKARARGDSIKQSCAVAGIQVQTGTVYERHAEMRKRISELRQGAEDFVGVSKAWIIQQLKRNADEAREEKSFKSSNEALGMIYKIITEDRDLTHQVARALSPNVSPKQLGPLLKEAFKAPRSQPALPADAEPFDSEVAE